MSDRVTLTREREIGILTIDNPPVNAFSPEMLAEMVSCVRAAEEAAEIKALVLTGRGGFFSAGGDVKLLQLMVSGRFKQGIDFQPILHALEDGPKLTVCAINGAALGGGLQIALACHYRIAVAGAQLGEPEVKLGLIPNAGGTQRLPRLMGVARAADMCARGEPVTAAAALACGILDRVVEADLLPSAVDYARQLVAQGFGPRRTRDLTDRMGTAEENARLLIEARNLACTKMRGRAAPQRAIDAVEAATVLPFEEGCRREAELFRECLSSAEARALIHLFLSERAASRAARTIPQLHAVEVKRAAVIGGGTMGCGIATVYAAAGIPVTLIESSAELLDRSMTMIQESHERWIQSGRLTRMAADAQVQQIEPELGYDRLSAADIVIEAVFEEMDLKKRVFRELDRWTRPDAILASNTSTLDIDEIARETSCPERVLGHHFFAPAPVMRLLEIVRGKATADAVIAASLALARRLGKVGVVVGNSRGFVGNRLYHRYQQEVQLLLEEGASVPEVDGALYNFGMAMGPLATADLSGLDVGWRIRRASGQIGINLRDAPLAADRLCELGRYGQKTGAGWYRYEAGSRKPVPDSEVQNIIESCAHERGISRRSIAAEEIVERAMYALVNEGARILAAGVAARASDIDVIYVNGYGFPGHRGGPMWFADSVGLQRLYARVCAFEKLYGPRWTPAPLLSALAESGGSFADLDRGRRELEQVIRTDEEGMK